MRADAMSCAGNPVVKTPHFDRLALEGVRFDGAYCAFPLCCPWRASLLTGKYPHSHGLAANHYPVPLNQAFLPEILCAAGYRTGYIGKWPLNGGRKHDPVPPGRQRLGFEHFTGFSRGHRYSRYIYYKGDAVDQPCTSRRYEPDYQTDQLIEFMQGSLDDPSGRPGKKPGSFWRATTAWWPRSIAASVVFLIGSTRPASPRKPWSWSSAIMGRWPANTAYMAKKPFTKPRCACPC